MLNPLYSGFCCTPMSPMHVVARVPVSGYTPGQTINIEIDVDNRSDQESDFSVRLMKVRICVPSKSAPLNGVK